MKIQDALDLIRFNKPTGVLLLFWPCAFACAISSKDIEYVLIFKFLLGAFLARSAGCIVNDIFDKDFDAKVERTKSRPLAVKRVSIYQAIILLSLLSLLALALLLTFNHNTIFFSFIAVPMVILYPLMKRITYFPQGFLGLTFNFGVLVAGMELQDFLSWRIIVLYMACFFWTLGYDTIYGFMDSEDDKKVGVKSLSVFIEKKHPKIWLICFYLIFLGLFFVAIYLARRQINFLQLVLGITAACQLIWQVVTLDIKSPQNCMVRFKSSSYAAAILLIAALWE